MKICWDNLKKIQYRKDREQWQNIKHKNVFYVYKDQCNQCKEPYLSFSTKVSDFCSRSCSTKKENHPLYNKKGINNPNWKGGYAKKNIPLYDTYAPQIDYAEQVRRNKDNPDILEVKCAYCGKWYIPKLSSINNRIKALNGGFGENRLYCSKECKRECPIFNKKEFPKGHEKATSREVQPELRQLVFERDNYECRKCGSNKSLHCHHIEGIRYEPIESADIDKCITYCKDCHENVHKKEGCKKVDMQCKGDD